MSLRQTDRIRLGGGSAFFNDRLDAALELVEKGDIDVLMIETLAERTLALLHAAQARRRQRLLGQARRPAAGPAAGLRQARNKVRHQWRRRRAGSLRRDDRAARARA